MEEILLFFPGKKESAPYIPLSVVYLGTALKKAGYKPRIVDTRVEAFEGLGRREYLFVGISSITGSQLRHGLEIAGRIRDENPGLPIVWGGVHPTCLPEQTASHRLVDIVIRGDGEETIVELADSFAKGTPLGKVNGLTYRQEGEIVNTPNRQFTDLNRIGNLEYGLIDLGRYIDAKGYFSYQSSRGCPHNCTFCYNQGYNKGSWRSKSAEVVIDELKYIVDVLGINKIHFQEDNFFVSKERAVKICSGIIEEGLDIDWMAYNRMDYFSGYEDEFISLIKRSGCNLLFFGGESGSQRILDYMRKDITTGQIIATVKKCKQFDITPRVSFVIGWPDESRDDVLKTLDFVDEIKAIHPDADICSLFVLIPFPGTPVHEIAVSRGAKELTSLEEWADWRLDKAELPWLTNEERAELTAISNIIRFNHFHQRLSSFKSETKKAWLGNTPFMIAGYDVFHRIYEISAKMRWKRRNFKYPYEWIAWGVVRDRFINMV